MAIASDGFVFVPRCIDDETLHALRAEADSLFRLKRSGDALSEDEYLDKGCALDFFTDRSLTEHDPARVSMDQYMSRRNGVTRPRRDQSSGTTSSSAPAGTGSGTASIPTTPSASSTATTRRSPEREGNSAAADVAKDPHHGGTHLAPSWTEEHVAVVREAIFGTLAGLARDALEAAPSASKDRHAGGAHERLLLFNEQFVVKPPRSSIEFGWHTDEREQLAMCVFAPGGQPPVYVSVWLALDDCDTVNGCLEVLPQAWNRERLQAPGDEDGGSVVCLPAKAGAAVVFLSNVWHRSGPNQADRPRRVFYAQYSLDVIRAAPSDPRPLSLAVPCLPRSRYSTNVVNVVRIEGDTNDVGSGRNGGGGKTAR